jgi:hypothetical protein
MNDEFNDVERARSLTTRKLIPFGFNSITRVCNLVVIEQAINGRDNLTSISKQQQQRKDIVRWDIPETRKRGPRL